MTTYLTIITTVLVITQIIRVTQNHISLFKQEKKIENTLGWLKENDVSEKDFEIQRKVFYLLYDKLTRRNADMECGKCVEKYGVCPNEDCENYKSDVL